MPSNYRCFLLAVIVACCAASSAPAEDWPCFRGPQHDGICRESPLKAGLSGEVKPLWEREIGSAFSSFAVVDGRVYTCGTENQQQVLFCFDAENGDVKWKQPIEKGYRDNFGDGTRATPTVDDGRVYIMGGHGRVLCCDAESGSEIWSQSFDHKPQWGYAGSILIEDGLAIFSAGKSDGALRAVRKTTGKVAWKCDNDMPGYATPLPFEFGGRQFVCGFAADRAVIADIKTGKKRLSIPWETDWKVNAAAPIYRDGMLFLNSGYHTGCGLFKLERKRQKLGADEIWRSQVLLNKFQSALLVDDTLYASDEKALKGVDFNSGEELWSQPRVANGTLVLADGNLWLLTEKGELQVGPPSRKDFTPLAKAQVLDGRCWTVPVISGGRLFVRNLKTVKCFDVRS